jgi:hypothetical protein
VNGYVNYLILLFSKQSKKERKLNNLTPIPMANSSLQEKKPAGAQQPAVLPLQKTTGPPNSVAPVLKETTCRSEFDNKEIEPKAEKKNEPKVNKFDSTNIGSFQKDLSTNISLARELNDSDDLIDPSKAAGASKQVKKTSKDHISQSADDTVKGEGLGTTMPQFQSDQ